MKKRIILGALALLLSLALAFVVTPLVSSLAVRQENAVVLKRDVRRGEIITADDVGYVPVTVRTDAGTQVPNIEKDADKIAGRYAMYDMVEGEILVAGKTSEDGAGLTDGADRVLSSLGTGERAVSVSVYSFAGGLSGKIEEGDIISVAFYSQETKTASIPDELRYVRVITATTSGGVDRRDIEKEDDGTYDMPSSVTLLVNEKQAEMLVRMENTGRIHAVLVCRGDAERADGLLEKQRSVLTGDGNK